MATFKKRFFFNKVLLSDESFGNRSDYLKYSKKNKSILLTRLIRTKVIFYSLLEIKKRILLKK